MKQISRISAYILFCFLIWIGGGCDNPKTQTKNDGDKGSEKQKQTANDSRPSSIIKRSLDKARKLSAAEQQGLRLTQTKIHRVYWDKENSATAEPGEQILVVDVTFEWMGSGFDLNDLSIVEAGQPDKPVRVRDVFLANRKGKRSNNKDRDSWPKAPAPIRVHLLASMPASVTQIHLQLADHRFNQSPARVVGGK